MNDYIPPDLHRAEIIPVVEREALGDKWANLFNQAIDPSGYAQYLIDAPYSASGMSKDAWIKQQTTPTGDNSPFGALISGLRDTAPVWGAALGGQFGLSGLGGSETLAGGDALLSSGMGSVGSVAPIVAPSLGGAISPGAGTAGFGTEISATGLEGVGAGAGATTGGLAGGLTTSQANAVAAYVDAGMEPNIALSTVLAEGGAGVSGAAGLTGTKALEYNALIKQGLSSEAALAAVTGGGAAAEGGGLLAGLSAKFAASPLTTLAQGATLLGTLSGLGGGGASSNPNSSSYDPRTSPYWAAKPANFAPRKTVGYHKNYAEGGAVDTTTPEFNPNVLADYKTYGHGPEHVFFDKVSPFAVGTSAGEESNQTYAAKQIKKADMAKAKTIAEAPLDTRIQNWFSAHPEVSQDTLGSAMTAAGLSAADVDRAMVGRDYGGLHWGANTLQGAISEQAPNIMAKFGTTYGVPYTPAAPIAPTPAPAAPSTTATNIQNWFSSHPDVSQNDLAAAMSSAGLSASDVDSAMSGRNYGNLQWGANTLQGAIAEQAPSIMEKYGTTYGVPMATGGSVDSSMQSKARDFPQRYMKGGSSGQQDNVPAMLSNGEYVMDAATVSDLGDGNSDAGAKALDAMRHHIRNHKRTGAFPPKAKSPLEYLKG